MPFIIISNSNTTFLKFVWANHWYANEIYKYIVADVANQHKNSISKIAFQT